MWVFCGGMMRSASTLQYQITAQLVEAAQLGRRLPWTEAEDFPELWRHLGQDNTWKVYKTHICTQSMIEEFGRANALGVYIYRDIRDAFTSQMVKEGVSAKMLLDSGFIQVCLDNYYHWSQLPQVLISRYETVMKNLSNEVFRIADHLGIDLTFEQAQQIANDFSLDKQQSRIEQSQAICNTDHHQFDQHSLLHINHIHSGKVGRWKTELCLGDVEQIEKLAGVWMQDRGYGLSTL